MIETVLYMSLIVGFAAIGLIFAISATRNVLTTNEMTAGCCDGDGQSDLNKMKAFMEDRGCCVPQINHVEVRGGNSSTDKEPTMARSTPDFSIEVSEIEGVCPAGEVYAKQNIADEKIPVLSCEGPCIRGEVARLAANIVADEAAPYARCCYAETFLVPQSSMTAWVKGAEKVVVIDGCFLKCIGRITGNVIDREKIIWIDTNPIHKRFSDVFLYTDVPEETRKAVSRRVADKILEKLGEEQAAVT